MPVLVIPVLQDGDANLYEDPSQQPGTAILAVVAILIIGDLVTVSQVEQPQT